MVSDIAKFKLYTLDNEFIKETDYITANFTGIVDYYGITKVWYKNGSTHRENGPAWVCDNGEKCWYINGKRHRLDGPAHEWTNGRKEYFIEGKQYTEIQHKLFVDLLKLKGVIYKHDI